MVTIKGLVNFLTWNITHPVEIVFIPRWLFEYRTSMLELKKLWSNYHINNYLEDNLTGKELVLEFGSGGSTLFFSKHTKRVTSIEHDKKWFMAVKKIAPKNCEVIFKEKKHYLDIKGKYDIVFIDGIRRLDCAKKALSLTKKGGMIIVDDANWPNSEGAGDYLSIIGLKYKSFKGIKPGDFNVWETRVYFV